ncbi:MAG: di-heme oxidoredictase family protein [Gemmataceae bacterium]
MKFGWRQFARLDDFVAAACANELGLGTPYREQAAPLTGNKSGCAAGPGQEVFCSLVSFVKTLPKPVQVDGPEVEQGRAVFANVGCAICHVPNMGGVKGVFSDFLLYTLEDPQPHGSGRGDYTQPPAELNLASRSDDDPKPAEWKTPALWGVADSAPYLHDGSARSLKEAILRHRGDATLVLKRFEEASPAEQGALLAFLGSLKAPPDAPQLRDPSITRLVKR